MNINLAFAFLFFVTFLAFIVLESILFYKVVKYLTEKIVLIKTFTAGLPVVEDSSTEIAKNPNFPDEDFGEGTVLSDEREEPEMKFEEKLAVGDELPEDELRDVGI